MASNMASKTSAVIAVLGSVNMDLVARVGRMPREGETLAGKSFFTAAGGKGANQAVAAARLGASVRMAGRVGADGFGRELLDGLAGNGVDVGGIGVDGELPTGVAMIMVDAAGRNSIVAVYGANMACGDAELDAVRRALEGADALMLQLEIPAAVSLAAARYARGVGALVVWDPAPAGQMPAEGFGAADVITPNRIEAEALTGIAVVDRAAALAAAEALVAKGAGAAVVKLGEQGAVAATAAGATHFAPPFAVDAIDSVAAGDAFGAGLAVALAEGQALEAALRFGSAAGALAVTKRGAQDAMPARAEVDALMRG